MTIDRAQNKCVTFFKACTLFNGYKEVVIVQVIKGNKCCSPVISKSLHFSILKCCFFVCDL